MIYLFVPFFTLGVVELPPLDFCSHRKRCVDQWKAETILKQRDHVAAHEADALGEERQFSFGVGRVLRLYVRLQGLLSLAQVSFSTPL